MYQKLVLVGNLGRDPELNVTPSGQSVCNLSLATNRRWKNQQTGEKQEETTWFRVSVWGKQAESANEYLKKGRQVLIEGRLKPDPNTGGPRVWTGQEGNVGASYEVTADVVRFLSGGDSQPAGEHKASVSAQVKEEDEIPF